MRQLTAFIMVVFCLISISVAGAASQPATRGSIQKFQYKEALKASQDAIGNQLSEYRLTNADSRGILLSELQGKPLVLSLIYTSCYQICPMTTRYLASVVEKARKSLGKDNFSVALLGFDSQFDGPQAMKHFAKKQGIENMDWHLLSADTDTIEALTKELGFMFFTSPNGFDHVVQVSIIDAEGKVYRQVYGEVFDTPLLIEPLKELILGRPQPDQTLISDLINKVRFFCTNYDPASDSYYFDYSLFIGMVIGALVIILGFLFILREIYFGRTPPAA
jgi:protein SCO1/2